MVNDEADEKPNFTWNYRRENSSKQKKLKYEIGVDWINW